MTRKLCTIDLFIDTGFDDTYKHVIDWDTQEELNNYLDSGHEKVSMKGSYQNINKPIRWDSSKISYNDLTRYTYLRITNEDPNGIIKQFYGFITNLEYINDGLIYIYYSIDMFNTYKWNISFNKAMIERGFVKELKNDFSDYTDEFKLIKNNEEPIGGDGCERLIGSNQVFFTKDQNGNYIEDGNIKFVLITAQPQDVTKDPGTFLGAFSQYKYYLMCYNRETGKMLDLYDKDGEELIKYDSTDDLDKIWGVYTELSQDPNFAGSSSLVVDSEVIDYVGLRFTAIKNGDDITGIKFSNKFSFHKSKFYLTLWSDGGNAIKSQKGALFLNYNGGPSRSHAFQSLYEMLTIDIGDAVQNNHIPYKLLSSPYTKLTLTDGRGNMSIADIFKFNDLSSQDINIHRFGGISENTKIAYALMNYNREETQDQYEFVTYENKLLIDDSPKDMPLILDNYTMFLNSNRNQLANSRANAKMTMQLAKEGNQNSIDNFQRSLNASNKAWQVTKNAQNENFYEGQQLGIAKDFTNSGLSVVGGIASRDVSAVAGGVTNAAFSGLNHAHQMSSYNRSLSAEKASRRIEQSAAAENARVNYAFNNKVASNNYEQTIKSQNAMLADVKNHNDVIAHQGTNNQWDIQNGNTALHGQLWFCQKSVMLNVCLYFLLFGYTVKRYGSINDYRYRKSNFNYIQTSNAQVSGTVAQPVINTFNAMFDSGVSLWRPSAIAKFLNRDYTYNEWT